MTTSVQGELLSADQAELMVRSISLQMIVFEVTLEIKEEDGRVCFRVMTSETSFNKFVLL